MLHLFQVSVQKNKAIDILIRFQITPQVALSLYVALTPCLFCFLAFSLFWFNCYCLICAI